MADPDPAAGDMATVTAVKLRMGLTGDDTYDDVLAAIVADVSARVKTYCGRNFLAAAYRHWLNGEDYHTMPLPEWPVIDLSYVASGTVDAMRVKYTGSSPVATIEVEDRSSLVHKVKSGATMLGSSKAFATYTTLTLLVAAMDATTDWSAERLTTDEDYQDPYRLVPFESGNARDNWVTIETVDVPITDYYVDDDKGELILTSGTWPRGRRNYCILYSAGYGSVGGTASSLISALPADLRAAVMKLVTFEFYQRNKDRALQSEKLDQYSYVNAVTNAMIDGSTGWPTDIVSMLDMYKRPR